MTTQELVESAVLEALGLLDDEERAAFEAAFRSAPPSVQAHVRREQTRLARIESLLPQVDPPPGLRARVLAAVRAAMADAVPMRLAPTGSQPTLPAQSPARVSRYWRAAAYGFATAAVLTLAAFLMIKSEYQDINHRLNDMAGNRSVLNTLGNEFAAYLGRDGLQVANFVPVAQDLEGSANLFFDQDTDTVYLQVAGLPIEPGRSYRLVILDETGRMGEEVISFEANGGYETPRRATLSLADLSGLAIVAVDAGQGGRRSTLLELPSIQ